MSVEPLNARTERAAPLRSAHFVLMFLSLSALFAMGQFHRSSGAVVSTVFGADLGLNAGQLGLAIGAMFIAHGLCQPPVGVLLDRFGARRILAGALLIAVTGCLTIAAAQSAAALIVGRLLLGIGFAAGMAGPYVVFVNWAPPNAIATLTGRLMFMGGLGGICATAPLALFIDAYGWRTAYVGLAALTLVAGVVAVVVTRDHPPGEAERRALSRPRTLKESFTGLIAVARSRRLRPILVAAVFLYAPMQTLVGLWAGPFLKDVHGLDPVASSHVILAAALGMSAGMLIYGPLERRLDRRRVVVVAAALVIALLFGALAAGAYANLTLVVPIFVAIAVAAPFFVVVLAHAQGLFEPHLAGRVVACVNLLGVSGIFVMQNVTAQIIEAVPHPPGTTGSALGYRLVFGLVAVVFVLLAAVYSRTAEIGEEIGRD